MGLFDEQTIAGREMSWRQGISSAENPDKVIALKGMEYIEDIERDTKYSSCLNTRIQAVVGKGWEIVPYSQNLNGKAMIAKRDQEIADFVRDQLKAIPVFETDIIAFFDHISKGFSLSEINYKRIGKGRWSGKIGLRNIRKRPARYFSFKFDKYGNYFPVQVDPSHIELDPNKFIHFINGIDDENPWGESTGSKVAFWVWLKKNIMKFWAIYSEKYGSPTNKVEIPKNTAPGSAEDVKADEILEALRTASGIKIPKGFEVGFLEATRRGEVGYESFRRACNDEIATLVLGQPLTSGEGTKGFGTHALGEVHAGVLNAYTLFDVIISSAAINNQLIRRLVDINFDTEYYPIFQWNSFNMSMLISFAQNLRNLVESGLRISANDIYERIGLRVPEAGEEILKTIDIIGNMTKPKGQDNKIAAMKFAQNSELDLLINQNKEFLGENEIIVQKYINILAGRYSDLAAELRKIKKLTLKEEMVIKSNFIKSITDDIFEVLILGTLLGKSHAKKIIGFSRIFREDPEILYEPFARILEEFMKENVITREEFDLLEQELRRQAFTIAGEQSVMVMERVRDALAQTIKAGGDWSVLKAEINSIFENAGYTRLKNYHLENVIRTNLQTLYSRSREEIFGQLSPEEFPNKMVIAVLDNRTRESHRALNKFTRSKNDPIWERLRTPFDYNCRCAIIALHKSIPAEITAVLPDLSDLAFVS